MAITSKGFLVLRTTWDDPKMDIVKYIIVFIPAIIYFLTVNKYALNMPRQDDYGAVLEFLSKFKKAEFADKFALLFSQHNEHRILSSRIVYVLYKHLFGEVNFRNIILLNVFILVLLFLNITYFIRKALPRDWYIAAFVLSMGLFDLNNFENADFAMAGMQNYSILLLFTSSILFYSFTSRRYLIPAVLVQVICVFSSGNGNLGSFFIVAFVVLNKDRFKTIVAILTFLIAAPLYYYHYSPPQTDFFTLKMDKVVPFFLHVAGAHFSQEYGIICGILSLVVVLVALLFYRKYNVKNGTLQLLCLLGFVLASMVIMSVFRGNLPLILAYSSRYFIYPHLLIAITFVFILLDLDGKKVKTVFAILAIPMLVYVYRANCLNGRGGFESFNNSLKTMEYDFPDRGTAKAISDEACKLNIYCIENHRKE